MVRSVRRAVVVAPWRIGDDDAEGAGRERCRLGVYCLGFLCGDQFFVDTVDPASTVHLRNQWSVPFRLPFGGIRYLGNLLDCAAGYAREGSDLVAGFWRSFIVETFHNFGRLWRIEKRSPRRRICRPAHGRGFSMPPVTAPDGLSDQERRLACRELGVVIFQAWEQVTIGVIGHLD